MISIVIPFYNEEKNLPILYEELLKVSEKLKDEWEIIFADDGSTDKSISNIILRQAQAFGSEAQARRDDTERSRSVKYQKEKIKIIQHRKRLGKGKALLSGFRASKGDTIVFMDADLQDDPKDIHKFLEKIDEGYDLVNGTRTTRKDSFILKIYSALARYFLKIFLRSPFTDINCGFKMFRRNILEEFTLYGNNFRFLPLATYYNGFKVTEIPVNNRPRRYGKSKFGAAKLFVGILDTLTAYFIYRFSEKPLHFFGPIGGVLFLIGFFISFYLTIERLFFGVLLYRRPILFLGILLIIVGIQIIMTGIIGELIVFLNKKIKV